MKLSLSSTSATNINKVILTKRPNSHLIEVNMEFIHNNKDITFLNKSLFLFASHNKSLTESIIRNNTLMLSYLTKTQTSDQVAYSICGLTDNDSNAFESQDYEFGRKKSKSFRRNMKKGFKKVLTIDEEALRDLTLFVGVLSSRQKKKRSIYSISGINRLTVLEDGGVPENNILLYEDKSRQNCWVGPAYQDKIGRWHKQVPGSGRPTSRLYGQKVPNTKVVYKSELDKNLLQLTTNTFSDLYNLNKSINSRQAIVNNLKTKTRNYFSPLYFAKTKALTLPLSFSFNQLDFFRNNGIFSRLIKNESDLLNSFDLLSTKILRKRVVANNPSSRLTGVGAVKDFDGREVVISGPGLKAASVIDLFQTNDILSVTSTDEGIRDLTFGLYSYGVEFVFLDNTYQKINNLLNQPNIGLRDVVTKLQRLYKEMLLRDNYDAYAAELSAPYIDRYIAKGKKKILTDAIKTYVSAMAVFYKNMAHSLESTPGSLATKIYSLSDPLSNGPEGTLKLIQLILDLIKEVEFYGNINNVASPADAAVVQMRSSKLGSGSRVIKIKYYFDELVDADDLTNNGFDYLSAIGPRAAFWDFRRLTYPELEKLISLEQIKFTSLSNTPQSIISLTPNSFIVGGSERKINSKDPNQKKIDSVVASSILASNKYKNSPIDFSQFDITDNPSVEASTDTLSILKNNLKVIEKESCTIEIDSNLEEKNIFNITDSTRAPRSDENYLDAAEKMSEQSPFVINNTGSISLKNFIMSATDNKTQLKYYRMVEKLNNDLLSYLVQTDYFTDNDEVVAMKIKNITDKKVFTSKDQNIETFNLRSLENKKQKPNTSNKMLNELLLGHAQESQILSQEHSYGTFLTAPVSANQIASSALKYGNIRKIQYLAGFRKINDSVMMGEPIWINLTNGLFSSFAQAGKDVLCRMVRSYSEFAEYSGIKSPFYDKMFFLSASKTRPTRKSLGSSVFGLLAGSSFAELNKISNMDMGNLKYSVSMDKNIQPNNTTTKNKKNSARSQVQTQNLYTNGGDFLLPNGQRYIGYYHLYYKSSVKKYVAMVGRIHTKTPHRTLRASSDRAKRALAKALANRGQRGSASSTARGMSGRSSGGGGY